MPSQTLLRPPSGFWKSFEVVLGPLKRFQRSLGLLGKGDSVMDG